MGLLSKPVSLVLLSELFVLFFIAGSLSGCSTLRYLDGSSEETVQDFRTNPSAKIAALRAEINGLRGQVENRDRQIVAINNRLQAVTGQAGEIDALRGEIERLEGEKSAMEEEIATLEERLESDEGQPARAPKIKVLTGTGKLTSAKKISDRLRGMGYKVERIDYAPRFDFFTDTVYYAPAFSSEASRLAEGLKSGAVCKPLTWPSVFDIIVVAGSDT